MNVVFVVFMIFDIFWKGFIGCVWIGRVKGNFIVNLNMDELSLSDLNLVYVCIVEKMVMIEM